MIDTDEELLPTTAGLSSEIDNIPSNVIRSLQSSSHVNTEKSPGSASVFVVDNISYTTDMPIPTHWSVGWADLMMIMFILFLSLYAYQVANQEFLSKDHKEIIGGDTTEALQTLDTSKATLPFSPIRPGLPLIAAGTIKLAEQQAPGPLGGGNTSPMNSPQTGQKENRGSEQKQESVEKISLHPQQIALIVNNEKKVQPLAVPPVPLPDEDILGPNPIVPGEQSLPPVDRFQEIYRLSKDALTDNALDKFAAIDIVPDKTVRIVLTGDLLFDIGESELSAGARESLQKVTAVIRLTPYMINIVGHTDNIPMRSSTFKSNWELSVARASTVARYLIDEAGMDPNQFVVSGYSSYRPVEPNTTNENRAKNRRVEIIISKRLPDPLPATAENLK
jgi:chemotaxis protein MotB